MIYQALVTCKMSLYAEGLAGQLGKDAAGEPAAALHITQRGRFVTVTSGDPAALAYLVYRRTAKGLDFGSVVKIVIQGLKP